MVRVRVRVSELPTPLSKNQTKPPLTSEKRATRTTSRNGPGSTRTCRRMMAMEKFGVASPIFGGTHNASHPRVLRSADCVQRSWGVAFSSLQRTPVLCRAPDSRHSKTGAQAPDGLGQGVSGQPGIPATPPDHQIDQQRCDRASFQAGSPCSQPPLTVCISPRARSHAAWRITHCDQCVSCTCGALPDRARARASDDFTSGAFRRRTGIMFFL